MWILNITPDSFYDGGKFNSVENAKNQIEKMIKQWVDIIDVWAFSSKPWSILPSVEEELKRLIPILDLLDNYNINFSVDTCRSEVVEKILEYKNLVYINDISWLQDEKILKLISNTNVWYILMHIKWTPENMQNNPEYKNVVTEVWDFFEEKLKIIQKYNIKNIVLDVWFGFWKNIKHNYDLLKNLDYFNKFNLPILAWLSRKSMMYKFLDSTPNDVLEETVALNFFALNKWANIIRVHDVAKHKNIVKIFNLMNNLNAN